jgi:hypothetical protein
MAVLWLEGFDSFGTTVGSAAIGLTQKYQSNNITANMLVREPRIEGANQGYSLRIRGGGGQTGYITTPNLGNVATIVVGFGFKRAATLVDFRIVGLRESDDATEGVNLRGRADGKLDVYNGATLIATTTEAQIAADTWCHIELKVTVAEAGSYEVRVNGNTVLSGSADTRAGSNNYANRVRLFGRDEATTAGNQFDDWFVADDDFRGDRKILTVFPAADVQSDFGPSAGSDNYANVDDNPPDADSTYNESSTPGAADLFTNVALATANGIDCVQVNIVAKKTDTTDFDMNLVAKSGATTSDGTAAVVNSTDYANYARILETDPDTGVAWTLEGLNAAQFGPKVG